MLNETWENNGLFILSRVSVLHAGAKNSDPRLFTESSSLKISRFLDVQFISGDFLVAFLHYRCRHHTYPKVSVEQC